MKTREREREERKRRTESTGVAKGPCTIRTSSPLGSLSPIAAVAAAWWSISLFGQVSKDFFFFFFPNPERRIKAYASSFLGIATGESTAAVDAALQFVQIGVTVVSVLARSFADFVAAPLLRQDLLLHDDVSQSGHGFQHAVLPADQVFAFGHRWQRAGHGSASLRLMGSGAEVTGEVERSSSSFCNLRKGVLAWWLKMAREGCCLTSFKDVSSSKLSR